MVCWMCWVAATGALPELRDGLRPAPADPIADHPARRQHGCLFSLRLAPGDPVVLATENVRDPAEIDRIRHAWGLDQPLLVQYGRYVAGVVQGDFGRSFFGNRAVS